MTLYVCLDDKNGMLFNHRRQSRDAAVLQDIQASIPEVLTIDPFSEKLIKSAGIPYVLAPEEAVSPEENVHFFLENREPSELACLASSIVLYRWNRHYPADMHWNVDLAELGFALTGCWEFPGKSHETITKEVYTR